MNKKTYLVKFFDIEERNELNYDWYRKSELPVENEIILYPINELELSKYKVEKVYFNQKEEYRIFLRNITPVTRKVLIEKKNKI